MHGKSVYFLDLLGSHPLKVEVSAGQICASRALSKSSRMQLVMPCSNALYPNVFLLPIRWKAHFDWINMMTINEFFESHGPRSEEHTSELQSRGHLVCRLLLEKKKNQKERKHEEKQDHIALVQLNN